MRCAGGMADTRLEPLVLTGDEQRALENWVRLRFRLASSGPMMAIIGAVGRLTDAGMTAQAATETVLRILHESESEEYP